MRAINMESGDPSLRVSFLRVLDNKICRIIAPHLVWGTVMGWLTHHLLSTR